MESSSGMLRLMLVDEQKIFLEGLASVLESRENDISIVAQVLDGKEAVELAGVHQPEIIQIMDALKYFISSGM